MRIPPFNRKSRVSSLQIPHLSKITHFLFENSHLTWKSRVFSSEFPYLSENHAFSLRES
ncbi:hypothetical protein CP10139811_1329, partial [Chlamydia ibidis]